MHPITLGLFLRIVIGADRDIGLMTIRSWKQFPHDSALFEEGCVVGALGTNEQARLASDWSVSTVFTYSGTRNQLAHRKV